MLDRLPLITASDRLYFAYGSNLSPEQMAHRCPDSIFLGKASLHGYRWQVNERGVANIVEAPAAPGPGSKTGSGRSSRSGRSRDRDDEDHSAGATVVEGLLYAISEFDERLLDQYEGVKKGRYEKFGAQVDFEPVRDNVFARCTSASVAKAVREERKQTKIADALGIVPRAWSWSEGEQRRSGRRDGGGGRRGASVGSSPSSSSTAAMGGGLKNSILELLGIPTSKTGRAASPPPTRGRDRTPRVPVTPVWAMVYASTTWVRDGDIKDRYVPRMERAMVDALALGVSRKFVDEHIFPHVFRTMPARRSSRRKSLAGGDDDLERGRGRREVESARRSVSRSDRHGRRDSVLDRSLDY